MKSYKCLLSTLSTLFIVFFLVASFCFPSCGYAARGRILLSEPDGSPDKKPVYEIEVPNGTLSETDGVGSISVEPAQTPASQEEAEAGTELGTRSWSPLRIFQAIAAKITATLGAAYDSEAELTALFGTKAPADFYDYYEISIEAGIDGAVAPDVAEVLSSTNKAVIRQFSGAANQDVFLSFEAPPDLKTGATGLYFRVIGFVSNATAPAENETIIFNLTGASIANSELLSSAFGAAVASTYTAPATLAQYDRVATPWSNLVTITGLAAGETIMLNLLRDTTDTYAQKFGVAKIQVKIMRTPSGT